MKEAPKKRKKPIAERVIQFSFPLLEGISPGMAGRLATRLFFTPIRFKPPQPEELRASDAEWSKLNVGEEMVQVYHWGDPQAPLAVFMHGWSGRGLQFREMIEPLLKQGFQVIAFDAPGHGRSTGKQSNIILFKDTLLALQEKFGTFHLLIAHSLGGAASWYARVEGLQVEKMVAISSPSLPAQIIEEYLARINGSPQTGRALEDYVFQLVGRSFESFGAYLNAPQAPPIPTLLVHDTKDREVGMEHMRKLEEVLPHAESHISEGLGHSRILRDTEIIETILNFAKTTESVHLHS